MTDQESTPQEGQEPKPATEPKAGQEPQAEAKAEPKTFDAEYVQTLRAEAAKHRKEAQEARAKAEEYEEAQKSELEKAQGKLTKAEQAKAEAEAKLLRYEIAQEKEVPSKLVPLLTGATREDLESQADLIIENVKAGQKEPDFDGGAREPAPEPESPEQAHNKEMLKLLGLQRN